MTDRIDLNQADVETLARLPGLGPALATRIIDYRTTVQPFAETNEITAVLGISEKRYRQFADQVTVTPTEPPQALLVVSPPEPSLAAATPDEVKPDPDNDEAETPPLDNPPIDPTSPEPPVPPAPSFIRRIISATLLVLVGALLGAVLALLTLQSINGTLDMASHSELLRLGTDLSTLQQQDALRSGELQTLRERVNQMEALSGRLQSAETDIETLQTTLGTVESQLDTLEGDTSQIRELVSEIEQATERFGGFLAGLRELLVSIDETPRPTRRPTRTATATAAETATHTATAPPATETATATPTSTNTPTPRPTSTRTPTPLPE